MAALTPAHACPASGVGTRGLHACLFRGGNILGSGLLKDRLDTVPLRAPVIPPSATPAAAPLSAAMIGPAAMKGPKPGMASAPIP